MKLRARFTQIFLMGLLFAGIFSPPVARAQETAPAASASAATKNSPKGGEVAEAGDQTEAFRHAAPVKKIAALTGMSVETTAKIFEDLNSAILIGLILWFILKTVPKMLRKRSENLQKQLLEAQVETAHAAERLAAVEERLSKLGIEIESFRQQTERDIAGDEKRIQEALEEDKKRIIASAEQEISAAVDTARRDLKKFAAELAVDRAMGRIHLSEDDDHKLIHRFAESLKGERN